MYSPLYTLDNQVFSIAQPNSFSLPLKEKPWARSERIRATAFRCHTAGRSLGVNESSLPSNFRQSRTEKRLRTNKRIILLTEEIRRSPVEVGSWNPIIYKVFYIAGRLFRISEASTVSRRNAWWSLQRSSGKVEQMMIPPSWPANVYRTSRARRVGGWTTHLKNMIVKMGSSSPIFGVKIKNIWVATT